MASRPTGRAALSLRWYPLRPESLHSLSPSSGASVYDYDRWSSCYTQHWRAPGYYTTSRNRGLFIAADVAEVVYTVDLLTMTALHSNNLLFADTGLCAGWDGLLYTSWPSSTAAAADYVVHGRAQLHGRLGVLRRRHELPRAAVHCSQRPHPQDERNDVLSPYHLCIMPAGSNVSQCEEAWSDGYLLTDLPNAFSLYYWNSTLKAGELVTRTLRRSALPSILALSSSTSDSDEVSNVAPVGWALVGAVGGVLLLALLIAVIRMRVKWATICMASSTGGVERLLG
jgi:hypothetical protein